MRPIRTIVAAVDFSPHSEPVVDAAVTLAKQFGAKIRLVHAYDVPIPLVSPYEVAIPEPYLEETRRMAAEKLAALVARVAAQGVAVDSQLGEVPAAPAIVRAAEEAKADLVVIGTRGHTGLKHLLLGSVAERTVRLAPCPVLTVKAGA
jgi:nucleotide-binding universal stress UspA family protein